MITLTLHFQICQQPLKLSNWNQRKFKSDIKMTLNIFKHKDTNLVDFSLVIIFKDSTTPGTFSCSN